MQPILIEPVSQKPCAVVDLPGSKSQANRAILCAAFASGSSTIDRFLFADDTLAMADCLNRLEVGIDLHSEQQRALVSGVGRAPYSEGPPLDLDARKSGTTARFLLPVLGFGSGQFRLDGDSQLQGRPFTDLVAALRDLGVDVSDETLPTVVQNPGSIGSECSVRGDISSQYLSGLMLAAPLNPAGLEIQIDGSLVSKPYVELTASVMRHFGAEVNLNLESGNVQIAAGGYQSAEIELEPDASAASYFFGAAAITGGTVTIPGLGKNSAQGDMAFVDALSQMGATVVIGDNQTTVSGTSQLSGIHIDMADFSDTAQTLAVVASYADSPTEITGIGFIKHKETDRVAATVAELNRAGVRAEETPDGLIVHPGKAVPTEIKTYEDHRMAMSFALLGLGNPGIKILDPECVSKTFPNYFRELSALTEG